MGNKISFKSARNLSLFACVFSIFSFLQIIKLLGIIFLLFIFPFLLIRFKQLMIIRYSFNRKAFFNLLIVIVIIGAATLITESIVHPIIWGNAAGTKIGDKIVFLPSSPNEELFNYVFTSTRQILLVTKGILFIILGGYLIKSFKERDISFKVLLVSIVFFGIYSVFAGISLMPYPLHTFYVFAHKTILIEILDYSEIIISICLFGSMFFEFNKENKLRHIEEDATIKE